MKPITILVAAGIAAVALSTPAGAADRSRAMEQHMRLMEQGNPGMQRMMELMQQGNPGMAAMMDAPPMTEMP